MKLNIMTKDDKTEETKEIFFSIMYYKQKKKHKKKVRK